LKILEEPHEDTMLILTTANPGRILPTIRSRCQEIRFDNVTLEEIAEALENRDRLERTEALLLSSLSGGSYGKALELNGSRGSDRLNDAVALLRASLHKPAKELLAEIDRLQSDYERAGLAEILAVLETWLRDARLIAAGSGGLQSGLDPATAGKFAAHYPSARYDAVFGALAKAISLIDKNVYIPLVLITLALDLRENILVRSQSAAARAGSTAVSL
jgi:DNA polymerase-3 subunit delta'